MRQLLTFILSLAMGSSLAQDTVFVVGFRDKTDRSILPAVTISSNRFTSFHSDNSGRVQFRCRKTDTLLVTATGYKDTILACAFIDSIIYLERSVRELEDVVVTGTMKQTSRSASPVSVEVYQSSYFRKSPAPSIFESLQMINGVRPQLNCAICNTGDIHINGMEGPYTLVLIDGMPIVSSLSSVYGLSGIPNAMVERIEIVKGPASSLYGSEAVGGLINVITKDPLKAALFAADLSTTSWNERNVDISGKFKAGARLTVLNGVNYFRFQDRIDKDQDGFTDVTQQHRLSVFQKLNWNRKLRREAGMALRYVYEDRWGGDVRWTPAFRGGDSLYAESIYTSRFEWIGNYQLPFTERFMFNWSYTDHTQRSWYGIAPFNGKQRIGFGQTTWDKKIEGHDLLAGAVLRYNWYDDNTPATAKTNKVLVPGIFIQDDFSIGGRQQLLIGLRWDRHKDHGPIFTPRLAWKYRFPSSDQLRVNAGTGFRTVNIFTEDHAALTGARQVIIKEALRPERSYNLNINFTKKFVLPKGWLQWETSFWYTHFTNRILPDYISDPDKIIYANLNGYSLSKGASINIDIVMSDQWKGQMGFTLQDVSIITNEHGTRRKERQMLTENYSANWAISYSLKRLGLVIDYTGNLYGPMLLPLASNLDPRPDQSPFWTVQHLQFSRKIRNQIEIYTGVKNIFDWVPSRNVDFLIARTNDPFDKNVSKDANGTILSTPDNPYALSFDPNYIFTSNQGRRYYVGLRFTIKNN